MATSPAFGPPPVSLHRDGAVAFITLNRPEALNAIDQAMADALVHTANLLAADPSISVVVLRGAGGNFCAGGDIGVFAANLDMIDPAIRGLLGSLHQFLLLLREMPKLVLTSISGAAAGWLSIAFMGDLCLAAEDARLRPAYARLGVSPDAGGTIGVVDAVGARRAIRIFLADEELDHSEALALGLVTRFVPAGELEAETATLAHRLAQTSPAAIAATKTLVYRRMADSFTQHLEAEMEHLIGCMRSDFFRDRVQAFVAKGR